MRRFRDLVVGVDVDANGPTPGSVVAVSQSVRLAARTGARVTLLASSERNPEDEAPEAAAREPDLDAALSKLAQVATAEHGSVDVRCMTSKERAWLALIRRVLAGEADLVVVAKRSHVSRSERRLGSVSNKLIRKCPCPVWALRADHALRHASVLAATDLTPVGDLAVEYAASLAELDDCRLDVVHAWQLPIDVQLAAARVGDEETERRTRAIADAAREHVRAQPAVAALGERAHLHVARDSPSHAIRTVVERLDPDLVVMGTVSRGGVAGFLVGNTAERLLPSLDCSLLTVKPDDFVCPVALDS